MKNRDYNAWLQASILYNTWEKQSLDIEKRFGLEKKNYSYYSMRSYEIDIKQIYVILIDWLKNCNPNHFMDMMNREMNTECFNWNFILNNRVSEYISLYYTGTLSKRRNFYPRIKLRDNTKKHILDGKVAVLKDVLQEFGAPKSGNKSLLKERIKKIIDIINDCTLEQVEEEIRSRTNALEEPPIKKKGNKCSHCYQYKEDHICKLVVLNHWNNNQDVLIRKFGSFEKENN